jgi:hypothetical protein
MLILAGIVIAVAAACCALLNWRLVVFILIGWGLVEGLVRRALPGQPAEVMLVDDVLVLFLYMSFVIWQTAQNRTWQPPFLVPFFAFSFVSVVGIFNPKSPAILFGLLGFHCYVWYVPLLWVGFAAFDNWDSARKFLWWLCVLTIPMTLLAAYQYVRFDSLPVALRPLQGDHVFHAGLERGAEAIKLVPSFFVNAEKFSRYCLMTFFLSLGLLVDGRGTTFQRRVVGVAVAASAAGIFLSGRRSPLYFSFLGFTWLMFGFYTKLGVRRAYRWVAVIVLAGAAVFLTARTQNPNAEYYQQSTASISERAGWFLSDMEAAYENSGLFGFGTGTLSQGLDYVPGGHEWAYSSSNSALNLWGETGLGKIMEELGLIGVVAFLVYLVSMSVAWFQNVRKLRGKAPYAMGAALAVYFSFMLAWFAKGHMIMGDPITLVQFWFTMGVFFALPYYRSQSESNPLQRRLPVSGFRSSPSPST